MSNYQRFMVYIYQYEGGEKKNNAGFARVEVREHAWQVRLQLKGTDLSGEASVFSVRPGGDKTLLGVMNICHGEGVFVYSGMYETEGALYIKDQAGAACYAEWRPVSFVLEKPAETEEALAEETVEAECVETQEPQETPEPEKEERSKLWQVLRKICPKRLPGPGYESWELLDLQLQDIGRLPRKNWIYGNNSFVVQGFYRYRHLVLAAKDREGDMRYLLGVPGTKTETEELLAALFGFSEFMPGVRKNEDVFGYWMVEVSMEND